MDVNSSTPGIGLAHFYCSFGDIASQDPFHIIASIAVQIGRQVESLLAHYTDNFSHEQKKIAGRGRALADLVEPLTLHAAPLTRIFICVDAVNECERANEVVAALFGMVKSCKNTSMLISSTTSYNSLDYSKEVLVKEGEMLSNEVDKDVSLYIKHILSDRDGNRSFSPSMKMDIAESVACQSGGV